MSKYKIVISDYYYPNIDQELHVFESLGDDVEIVDCTKVFPGGAKSPEQLSPIVRDADALIVQFAQVNAEVIEAMQRCKVIARYAIGVDTIDIEAATKKGIHVANVPDYCIDEVANTAIGHLLNAMRKISLSRDLLLRGEFSMDAINPIKRMCDSTLCLLGFGNIARNVYLKSKHLFGNIVAYDPYFPNKEDFPDVVFLPLEEALAQADAISIHVPLNKATREMISQREFRLMKNGVILVNTARGGLINEQALLEALETGRVGFCGLDVLNSEDFKQSPFLRHPNVCLTPHIGWNSEGALLELQRKTAENVVSALENGQPTYCVNCGG
jgi:D-3-phosphoglycerate dehydrogenase